MEAQTPSHNKAADHGTHYACADNPGDLLDGGGCNVSSDNSASRDCIDIQRIKGSFLHNFRKKETEMNREIKFRGKQIDKGIWIVGQYIMDKEREGTSLSEFAHKIQPFYKQAFAQPVIPETVGQYIGVKDKNGKEIYEGDVVKDEHIQLLGVVKFSERYLQFVVDDIHDGEQDYSEFMNQVEVIGNAYENVDLLKKVGNI